MSNSEFIIENLNTQFGESYRWQDFQILAKKLDHLLILGLDKLQHLTNSPGNLYSRQDTIDQDDAQSKPEDQAVSFLQVGPADF